MTVTEQSSVQNDSAKKIRDTAVAPGKVILSGEHSVVYGAPAVAVAVDRHTELTFTPMHKTEGVRTAFDNLSHGQFYPLELLKTFKAGLDRRFDQFVRGDLPVQKILQRPDDLAVYTIVFLMHILPLPGVSQTRKLPVPGQLNSRTALPMGAGMGSSAAIIAATLVLYEHMLNMPQTLAERFDRVRFCERLQHGKGSAIDAAAVVYGGVNRVQEDELEHPSLDPMHSLRTGGGWYWVLHGIPTSSTGECVAAVRNNYGEDAQLWQAFEQCTNAFEKSLGLNSDARDIIRENHQLLTRIGIVPAAAQRFIDEIERHGGAAKVSGAGSVRGDNAGIILVHMPDDAAMESLMGKHPDLRWEQLRIASQGAHLRPAPQALPAAATPGAVEPV
ncbi:MAG: GHMP kinase [Pseudomonadota bacterium]